ncbi:MAG: hypothetical protein WC121_05235 [Candidatus Kapaibacterium sp.]
MKVIGIILISLFLFSCDDDPVLPDKFVDSISYRVVNVVNSDTYIVNDAETGIDNIVLLNYKFISDSNQLFYRIPVPNRKNPANFYTSKVLHDTEFPDWNRIDMREMILYSEDYGKIEFTLDKLDDQFIKDYRDSSRFNEFKTPDRYSLIVEGYYRKNGKFYSFNLNSKYEGKIGAIFSPETRLYYNIKRSIKVEMSAESFFTIDGKVLEPLQSNMPLLEKNFNKCLKATAF